MDEISTLQRRFLAKYCCAWCGHSLDREGCSAIFGACSPELRAKRLEECLKAYKPRAQKDPPNV